MTTNAYRVIYENEGQPGEKPLNQGNPVLDIFNEFVSEGWIISVDSFRSDTNTVRSVVDFVSKEKRDEFKSRADAAGAVDRATTIVSEGELI